jgi:hypothetical protein
MFVHGCQLLGPDAAQPSPTARTIKKTLNLQRLAARLVMGNIVLTFVARGALSMTMQEIAAIAAIDVPAAQSPVLGSPPVTP